MIVIKLHFIMYYKLGHHSIYRDYHTSLPLFFINVGLALMIESIAPYYFLINMGFQNQ